MSSNTNTIRAIDDVARFRSLWLRQQHANCADNSQAVYQKLLDAYNQPHRVYHNLEHIESCLTILDRVSAILDNPDAVELAIWFHDVIYKLGANDNEPLSADLFMTLTDGQFSDELRHSVYQHIMATCHDCSVLTHSDTKLMVDIDLFSFGSPWPDFLKDSKKVRAEMNHIPDAAYYQKQMSFQLSLLDKPWFFNSDYFREHYEAQARSNLARLFELISNDTF